jgi:hypothetical protein
MLSTGYQSQYYLQSKVGAEDTYHPLPRPAEGTTRPLMQPRGVSGSIAWRNIEWIKREFYQGI